MDFRTTIPIPKADFSITHQDGIMLMGSCFTENIGHYLKQHQFRVNMNPFGIIYNPISLFNNLENIIQQKVYTEQDLLPYRDLYLSPDHHGSFSGTNVATVLAHINTTIQQANEAFRTSRYIIFTLGTAMVYEHKALGRVVANCHKLPGQTFHKRLLTIDAIKSAFQPLRVHLKNKKVLFTVSPVRHWRDGAVENTRSKSILIESIHQIISENDFFGYFPAYELMMDELRDYRFYEEDMLHPNATAIKYIWERFGNTYFDTDTQHLNTQIGKIRQLLNHRIKHAATKEQKEFEAHVQKTITDFRKNYPTLETDF